VFWAAAWLGCVRDATSLVAVEDGRLVMATVLDVSLLVEPGREAAARDALRTVFDTAQSLSAVADRFDPESDVSRLNAAASEGPVEIGRLLYEMLARAEAARVETRGSFDVTVGPLVELWTQAARRGRTPSQAEVVAARALVGHPVCLGTPGRAGLDSAGMSIDLGGLAKGFAIDQIAAELARAGITRSLLSFGQSSIWAGGQPWRLAVQRDDGSFEGVVELSDEALSMSSSLSQSSLIDGISYGHVIDPRSGQALRARRSAVVVASSATLAEVLSTALLVLDEKEGRRVVSEQGAEAWVRGEDGVAWRTEGWPARTGFGSD
jgi:thiamine biosynthesis lipoprotein